MMQQKNDSEWSEILEAVCNSVVAENYEETDLINVENGTICPLLPQTESQDSDTCFVDREISYDTLIRKMIEENACTQEDREQLATLFSGQLVERLKETSHYSVRVQIRDSKKQGEPFWKRIDCSFFRNDEKSILFLISDIQEEEDVKKRLMEAAEAAEAANKAKSAFLANMSHEIRTPMNAIVGISEVLLRQDLPPEILNSISTIQNSGSSLLGIINDILDFSKIETGKFEIIDVDYMLPSLLMDISNVISVRLAGKDVYFMMDIDPKLPNHFIGDDIRLKQILMNLIGNAVKFTHEGFIELKVRGEQVEEGVYVMSFAVRDSGIGIKEEDIGKLFSNFSQVDTRRNRATTGSGLGLSISKSLAQLMGGDVTVESVYGKGSTFTAYVRQQVPRYVPLGEVKDKSVRILICETNESIVHGLSAAMENLGLNYEVCREVDRVRDYPGMTHVLVRRKLFEKMEEKLEFMFEHSNILLILDHDEHAEGAFMDYKQLQLPLITLQLVNALNGEEIISSIRRKSFDQTEIIPLTFAKILLVDDNVTNLQVAKGLMLPYQMEVDTTTSGFKAIEMVKKKQYDVIFMDHMMPEMDGIETAHYIRGLEGDYYKTVPIIALTANAMSDARDMFREAGMDDFVAKPIEMRELHRVIKKYIQSKASDDYLKKAREAVAAEQAAARAKETEEKQQEKSPSIGSGLTISAGFIPGASSSAMEELLRQNGLLLQQNMKLLEAVFSGVSHIPEPLPPVETEEAEEPVRSSIPGLDMDKCIENYGGSIDIYHNILKTYYADMKEKEVILEPMVSQKDTENFTIQVHAVKSASRGVGAFDLGEDAWQLEQAGKAGDWDLILEKYPAFREKLHEIIGNVGEYVEQYLAGEIAEEGEMAEDFDPEIKAALKEAVEQMDYLEAENLLQILREKSYPEETEKKLRQLMECCRMFDYDQLDALVMKL